jgi:hypothetical protein
MPIKSVWLGLNFEEAPLNNAKESYTAAFYAVELWARERAHLSVFLGHASPRWGALHPRSARRWWR